MLAVLLGQIADITRSIYLSINSQLNFLSAKRRLSSADTKEVYLNMQIQAVTILFGAVLAIAAPANNPISRTSLTKLDVGYPSISRGVNADTPCLVRGCHKRPRRFHLQSRHRRSLQRVQLQGLLHLRRW